MKQYLEQRMYDSPREEENLRTYQVGDLEELSASALYANDEPSNMGKVPLMIQFGKLFYGYVNLNSFEPQNNPIKPLGSCPLKPLFGSKPLLRSGPLKEKNYF